MPTLTRPAALVRQGSLRIYVTSIKVRDLRIPNFYTITKLDPETSGPGFQRLLNDSRARKLADYLLDSTEEGDAFLPTSIFIATNKDVDFNELANTITFDVAEVGPFNVVDGQHRIAGLVMAAEKNAKILDFEIPVNIAVALDEISQMCHFLIVNTTQRPVEKAVEEQIIARLTAMVGLEKMPTIPRWIRRQIEKGEDARALVVVNFLNTDAGSPWRGKIKMAMDKDGPATTINQHSFLQSIKKYIFSANNPLSNPVWDKNRPMILSNYWKAVAELTVDPESTTPSIVYKTIGVDLFHIVSATVFAHLVTKADFKKDSIKSLLNRGFSNLTGEHVALAIPQWWQRGGGASGINSAAMRKHAMALSHAINVQDNFGEISL